MTGLAIIAANSLIKVLLFMAIAQAAAPEAFADSDQHRGCYHYYRETNSTKSFIPAPMS